jgi:hypothetical protein
VFLCRLPPRTLFFISFPSFPVIPRSKSKRLYKLNLSNTPRHVDILQGATCRPPRLAHDLVQHELSRASTSSICPGPILLDPPQHQAPDNNGKSLSPLIEEINHDLDLITATLEYLLPVNCRKNTPHLHAVSTANSATLHRHRKLASVSLTSTSPTSPCNVFSKTRNLQTPTSMSFLMITCS